MQTKAGAKKAAETRKKRKLAERKKFESDRLAAIGGSQQNIPKGAPSPAAAAESGYSPAAELQRNQTAIGEVLDSHRKVVSAQTLSWAVEQAAMRAIIKDDLVTMSRRDFDAIIALAHAARETNS